MNLAETIRQSFTSGAVPGRNRVYNLAGSATALLLALSDKPFIMVEHTEAAAQEVRDDVAVYLKLLGRKEDVLFVPPPGDVQSAGERAEAAVALQESNPFGIVTTSDALGASLWEIGRIRKASLELKEGADADRAQSVELLRGMGYVEAPLVTEPGQFSLRGYILDVFPASGGGPYRVEFFGDVVDGIRLFDVDSQRSITGFKHISLMPAAEPDKGPSLRELCEKREEFINESACGDGESPEGFVRLSRFSIGGEGLDSGAQPMGGLGLLPEERESVEDFAVAIRRASSSTVSLLVCSSDAQAERLIEIIREGGVVAPKIEIDNVAAYEGHICLTVGRLSAGLHLPGLLVLTEREIFGGGPAYRAMRRSRVSKLINSLEDFKAGDYVVHYDHGIGRFKGIVKEEVEGSEHELMAMDYAGGERLYLPLNAIDRIKKYSTGHEKTPLLDRLGARSWQRTRDKVKKRVKDLADKLLKVHAEREVTGGATFSSDTEMHREFDRFFAYEETPDQATAIEEIKRDMERPMSMDRLLCGDVGYGKTEVAMRSAFKAVYDGRQVAVLVPTTLLCEQHCRVFKKRFSAFPVTVDYLSRFKTPAERRRTREAMKSGRVDIVIATHAILSKKAVFANLGLLIIDEEHRFGVRQKERLKEMSRGVDVLSMSATPIPRTLQMAVSGIRSMSVIETPPEDRLAVTGSVSVYDDRVVKEAIGKELARGGQVYFVHNRITDIDKVARSIRRLVPDAQVAVAHGRTPEKQLEKVMLDFVSQKVDILVSTAIVGSGLDIPTVNTIIVDMAERMGLADLYQLKGRVGRSNVKARAYFLVQPAHLMKDGAAKRLQAIQELNYMGAGLRLAKRDLEIRGAGNLLGPEQSGYIDAVGIDLYLEMLERAVAEAKGEKVSTKPSATVDISLNASIPDDYINDVAQRLGIYRAVASAGTEDDLDALEAEASDRFGPHPVEFSNLIKVMRLRLMAERVQIIRISQSGASVSFKFSPDADFTAERVMEALGRRVRFSPDGFELSVDGGLYGAVSSVLRALMEREK